MFQTAAWLTETTSLSEEFAQHVSEPVALKALLLHHRQLGNLSSCECNRKDVMEKDVSQACIALPVSASRLKRCALFVVCFSQLQLLTAARRMSFGPLYPYLAQTESKSTPCITVVMMVTTMRKRPWQ